MNVLTLRLSCPVIVRHIWNAIDYIHHQRQFANFERIRSYVNREYGMSEEQLSEQLDYCVRDGLLIVKKSAKKKKAKVNNEEDGYAFPSIFKRETHDWYCFRCHLPGEVLCCSSCYRVFHNGCIAANDETGHKFVCNVCNTNEKNVINVERLNYLLGFEFKEFKKKLPSFAIQWPRNESKIFIQRLIYNPMDLDDIWKKISSTKYNHLVQFKVDIQTILHNIMIYEGEQSVTAVVKEAVNDCVRNIKDIQLCADCYQMSHEKRDEFWFCKPCDPPHDLVYAKVKGYPFWPAKVIEKINEQYDVRFFGSLHQRALVEKNHIKPINESIDKLQKQPKTVSWQKACQELKIYKLLLQGGQNFCDLQGSLEIRSQKKKRKRRGKICNEENEIVIKTYSLENISKNTLKRYVPIKRQINSKRNKFDVVIQRSKGQNGAGRKKMNHSKENIPKNITVHDSNVSSFPTLISVGIQTTCFSMHGHRKYVLDQENKFLEVNYDCNEMVTRIVNIFKQKQDGNKSEQNSHAFCNVHCPLNRCRKNIVSDSEIQQEIKRAIVDATNIINAKYGEIVDNMAQSYMKMIREVQKKIWCVVCRCEAAIHCCWGVDYCSQKCRDKHWERGHSKIHMDVDLLCEGETDGGGN